VRGTHKGKKLKQAPTSSLFRILQRKVALQEEEIDMGDGDEKNILTYPAEEILPSPGSNSLDQQHEEMDRTKESATAEASLHLMEKQEELEYFSEPSLDTTDGYVAGITPCPVPQTLFDSGSGVAEGATGVWPLHRSFTDTFHSMVMLSASGGTRALSVDGTL